MKPVKGINSHHKPICVFDVYWKHLPLIDGPDGTKVPPPIPVQNNERCKFVYATLNFFTPAGSFVYYDIFNILSDKNSLLSGMCARRFEGNWTAQDIIQHIVPRLADYATKEFVMKYQNGCRIEVMSVHELKVNPAELDYKKIVS